MASRSGSQTRARDQVVMVRMTAEEKAKYAALAERRGLSMPDLLRLGAEVIQLEETARTRQGV